MKIDDNQVIEVDDKKKKVKDDSKVRVSEKLVKTEKVSETKDKLKKVPVSDVFNNKKKITVSNVKVDDNKFKYIMFFILGFIIAFAGFYSFNDYLVSKETSTVNINENGITNGINKVYDAVVYIENYNGNKLSTSGTGFVYKKQDGKAYILTNNHVVSGSTSLKVTMADGKKVSAKFLGGDEYLDLACLSIDDKYVTKVATLGNSSSLALGSTLFTVGSPVGDEYRGTVTRGILSGKDRFVSVAVNGANSDYIMKVIQTDAAMNPGNSGGPLCNAAGEVIGINSLKLVKNEIEGMGFAIAIEDVIGHLNTFESGKKIKRPYLGVAMINLSDKNNLAYYGLADSIKTNLEEGIVIEEVEEGTASYGKLQRGDIVTKVNGVKVSSMAYFRYELYKYEAGDRITITVERNGRIADIVIVLQTKDDNTDKK